MVKVEVNMSEKKKQKVGSKRINSEVFKEYAMPILSEAEDDLDALRFAALLAKMCWNLTLFPEDQIERHKYELIDSIVKDINDFPIVERMVDFLISRKLLLFDEFKWFIIDVNIYPHEKGWKMMVTCLELEDSGI